MNIIILVLFELGIEGSSHVAFVGFSIGARDFIYSRAKKVVIFIFIRSKELS